MALRCAVLAALVVCSYSFRKNAHRVLANEDAPDGAKTGQGSSACSKLVAEFGVDIMNRMMAAGDCGMEQDAIQKDHTISAKGTKALCSPECQGRPEFVKRILHIDSLQIMCTDRMSRDRLRMAAPGYIIAKALKAAWEPCQEDPGIDVPFMPEDEEPLEEKDVSRPTEGTCQDRLKAFQAEVMGIIMKARPQCSIALPGGNTDGVNAATMCTEACQSQALGPPQQDINILKAECTDAQDVKVIAQTEQGYVVAQKILDEWNACPAPTEPTTEVDPTPDFDPVLERDPSAPVKPVVDLGAFNLDIEGDLACGPKTTAYVDHMLELVYDSAIVQQEAAANATAPLTSQQQKGPRKYLSCTASCYSVYTKFSEVAATEHAPRTAGKRKRLRNELPFNAVTSKAEDDDCDGAPYRKGEIGQYRTNDAAWLKETSACPSEAKPSEAKPHGWLQQLKHGDNIPCNSLYLSSDKASGGEFALALSGVQRIRLEVLAAKHFIQLAPKAGDHPALDCRYAYCKKVAKVSDNDADQRSLGGCVAQCAASHLLDEW